MFFGQGCQNASYKSRQTCFSAKGAVQALSLGHRLRSSDVPSRCRSESRFQPRKLSGLPQARDDCCTVSATNLGAVAEALCLQRYTDFYSLFGRFDQLRAPASAAWQTRQFASICCAKGAISFPAWGIAPGIQSSIRRSAESAIQCSIPNITLVEIDACASTQYRRLIYCCASPRLRGEDCLSRRSPAAAGRRWKVRGG
jgi:hypothetical protein